LVTYQSQSEPNLAKTDKL